MEGFETMSPNNLMKPDLDFHEAGCVLAKKLALQELENPVVVGIVPRGALLAISISEALHAQLEIMPVRTLRDPAAGTRRMGIVTEHEAMLHDCPFDVPQDYIYHETSRLRQEMMRDVKSCYGGIPRGALTNRTVILADDMIRSGITLETVLKEVRRQGPQSIIVAVVKSLSQGEFRVKNACDQVIVVENLCRLETSGEELQEQLVGEQVICEMIRNSRAWSKD